MAENTAGAQIKNLVSVKISSDEMLAFVTMKQPGEGVVFDENDLRAVLKENGVKSSWIDSALRQLALGGNYGKSINVAKGSLPVDGDDGVFTPKFDKTLPQEPVILSNGSFNFENLNFLQMVEKDQLIYEYTKPTRGKFGSTVTGKLLHPKPGVDAPVPEFGKGCYTDKDGSIRAQYQAHLYYRDGVVELTPALKIEGKLNDLERIVDMDGDIVIMDEIQQGSTLRATGDIVVYGSAASCDIHAGGRVFICSGMQAAEGSRFVVEGKKGVWGRFFEGVNIRSGGDVYTNHLIRCSVVCEGYVHVAGGKGVIIGGDTRAALGVYSTNVGNHSETDTIIELGMSDGKEAELRQTEEQKEQYMHQMESLAAGMAAYRAATGLEDEQLAGDPKYMKLKEAHTALAGAVYSCNETIREIEAFKEQMKEAFLSVSGSTFPNVEVVYSDMKYRSEIVMRRRKFLRGQLEVEVTVAKD